MKLHESVSLAFEIKYELLFNWPTCQLTLGNKRMQREKKALTGRGSERTFASSSAAAICFLSYHAAIMLRMK